MDTKLEVGGCMCVNVHVCRYVCVNKSLVKKYWIAGALCSTLEVLGDGLSE